MTDVVVSRCAERSMLARDLGGRMLMRRLQGQTKLRARYARLRSASTTARVEECRDLARDPDELINEFVEAVEVLSAFDNKTEPFYPGEGGRTAEPTLRGAIAVMKRLASATVSVPAADGYRFRIWHREVPPLRATGASAPESGRGGIDYVALREDAPSVPILGEIKCGSDKDAYYAFVQLLTYLAEMSPQAQLARANRFLFDGNLGPSPRYDLHILLAYVVDRGKVGESIPATRDLVSAFRSGLATHIGTGNVLGQVLCLRMSTGDFSGSLDLAWAA